MARLKVNEAPQQGMRTGQVKGARSAQSTRKASRSPAQHTRAQSERPPCGYRKKKKQTYLSKDAQAALLVKYLELPKESKRKGDTRRADALEALCREYDVNIRYPQQLYLKIKEDVSGGSGPPQS